MYQYVRAPRFNVFLPCIRSDWCMYRLQITCCDQWIQNTIVSATVLQYSISKLHPDVTNHIISGPYPFLRQIRRTHLVVYFLGHCRHLPQEPCSDVAMYSLLDLSYARWLSALSLRSWGAAAAAAGLMCCAVAVTLAAAAPHDLATSHDQFSVARSLPRWTSRRARCFHALTPLLVCLLPRCFHSN